jgi:hypothetical protein
LFVKVSCKVKNENNILITIKTSLRRSLMKKSNALGAIHVCVLSLCISSSAQSAVIDAYFGMNFVGGTLNSNPLGPIEINLLDITYSGGGGSSYTTAMPVFGGTYIDSSGTAPRNGLPDYTGLSATPTYTTQPVVGGVPTGDGETTRSINQTIAINWNTTGAFPVIDITSITVDTFVFAGPWTLGFNTPYRVGLIPPGAINELDSLLFTPFGDIYDGLVGVAGNPISSAVVTSAPAGLEPTIGSAFGDFIFAAAQPVPIPATIWLFGSGMLGLIGISRRKKAT